MTSTRPDTLRVITPPSAEPVTLDEVRAQIGLMPDQTEHDTLLAGQISTARRLVEVRLGIAIAAQECRATWHAAPEVLRLPAPPLLTGSGYPLVVTADGDELFEGDDYEVDVDAVPATITLSRGRGRRLVVTYWAGVEAGGPIDPLLRSAILCYVDHQFNNRGVLASESSTELPQAFETLLAASSWNGGW
jgi:uncharacterized phiE125 gp8 family phage protein